MKLKLLTPLLLVLSSTSPTAHADAGEKFTSFDHLIPLVQEAGMEPAESKCTPHVTASKKWRFFP